VGEYERGGCSVEPAATQVVGYDHIGDRVKHKLDVVGIRGAGLVAVDLLGCALVLCLELGLDVSRRLLIGLLACNGKRDTLHTHHQVRVWRIGTTQNIH
jgi:hypothetical protein